MVGRMTKVSTDLRRRLTEGADNIHSIGAGRAADLLREAASALQEDLMTEDEWRDRESAKISEESDAILRATQPWLFAGRVETDKRSETEACVVISADAPTTVTIAPSAATATAQPSEDASLRPYFVGPHLYIAEDEVEARAFHSDMVATSLLKLNDLRDVIASNGDIEDGDRWDALLRIDALIRMLQDSGEIPSLGDLDAAIVEFCEDAGWVKVSKKDAAEWCDRGKGNVGVLQSYYESKVKPHLDALTMLAVKVGSEVRP
jgi:hypothetical protein